jgi:hypothetical protein
MRTVTAGLALILVVAYTATRPSVVDRPTIPPPPDAEWQGPGYWTKRAPGVEQGKAFVMRFQRALRDAAPDNACSFTDTHFGDVVRQGAAVFHRTCEEQLVHEQNDRRATRARLLLPIASAGAYVSDRGISAFVKVRPALPAQRLATPFGTTIVAVKAPGGAWGIEAVDYE